MPNGPTAVSVVLSQRKWFKAGDIDDCWVLSAIQCASVSAPWLYLPTVTDFRAAAGDPDDGKSDGGNPNEIAKGVIGTWPQFKGKLKVMNGGIYDKLIDYLLEGRPCSVAFDMTKVPDKYRYGVTVPHQMSIVVKDGGDGAKLLANPMAPVEPTRWARLGKVSELRDAILGYGKIRSGSPSVYAVAFPTEEEMAGTWGPAKAYAAKVADLHNAALIEERDEAKAAAADLRQQLTAASAIAAAAIEDAKAARASLDTFVGRFGGTS
jgi:hypothetical protein